MKSEVSMERCTFGIDIGTTTISAAVLSETGRQLEELCVPNGSFLPGDEKAQDAEKICLRVQELAEQLLSSYPNVKAIGLTGQMHGVVYLNADGLAVSPLYTWQNDRGSRAYDAAGTYADEIRRRTGCRVSSGYGLCTVFYDVCRNTVPQDAASICTIMDYVGMRLCGRKSPLLHDSNAASFGLFDVENGRFFRDKIADLQIPSGLLPEVTRESAVLGTWRNIPVAVAIGDNQASCLGSCGAEKGLLVNFGTGSQISVISDTCSDLAEETRPFVYGKYLLTGSALCGGRAYALLEKFFRRYAVLCGGADVPQYDILNKLAEQGMLAPVSVQTTFCGTRQDPDKDGTIAHITEQTFTPESLAAGVLYGMAEELHGMYLAMGAPKASVLMASGNAVRKNPVFREILSRVFGMPVEIPEIGEEAATGAAMFAQSAC